MPKKQIRISLDEDIINDLKVMGNGAGYTAIFLALYANAKETPGFDPFGAVRAKQENNNDEFNKE